jgi:hypothetical protein
MSALSAMAEFGGFVERSIFLDNELASSGR